MTTTRVVRGRRGTLALLEGPGIVNLSIHSELRHSLLLLDLDIPALVNDHPHPKQLFCPLHLVPSSLARMLLPAVVDVLMIHLSLGVNIAVPLSPFASCSRQIQRAHAPLTSHSRNKQRRNRHLQLSSRSSELEPESKEPRLGFLARMFAKRAREFAFSTEFQSILIQPRRGRGGGRI